LNSDPLWSPACNLALLFLPASLRHIDLLPTSFLISPGLNFRMARNTSTFRSRISSELKFTGTSIATIQSNCSKWFLYHITQGARAFIIFSPIPYAELLR
jgi:hypothetical protein